MEPQEETTVQFDRRERRPNLFRRFLAHPVTSLFFGVLLPVCAVGMELCTGACGEMFWNPMPNLLLTVMISVVPLFNFVAWLCRLKGWDVHSPIPRALCGFSFAVSVVYAVFFLPLTVFGLLGCLMVFWYFGIGFLGLLPAAPLCAAIASFGFARGSAKRLAAETGEQKPAMRGFGWGMAVAGAAWLIALTGVLTNVVAWSMAASDDSAKSAKGVRLLRANPLSDLKTYNNRGNLPWWFAPHRFLLGDLGMDIPQEKCRVIHYRVTGENPDDFEDWGGRRHPLRFDFFTGGEKIGGVLENLSLKGSNYETSFDLPGCTGYAEWTLVFENTKERGEAEARARIALPPGGVVSRLTLWVNGEEQEAAFGTRGQVRRAYESVVHRRRDPVLVNVAGPDQVQMQCFPVPPKGEMKVRIGITTPLAVTSDGKARLRAPAILAQNFSIPGDLLGLPCDEVKTLDTPPASITVYADEKFAPLNDAAVVQRMERAKGWMPERVAVVLDASGVMAPFAQNTIEAIASIPASIDLELWIVGDEAIHEPTVTSRAGDKQRNAAIKKAIRAHGFAGGRCNLTTLVSATGKLAASDKPSALVWVHHEQPLVSQTADFLSSKLAKAEKIRMFLCQVAPGRDAITSSLASLPSVSSCTAETLNNGTSALKGVFEAWGAEGWRITRTFTPKAQIPSNAVPCGKHIGRLWASEEVCRVYRVGDPKTLEKAQKLALPWQIVTPVTGAVVLETAEQYKENNLKQADADSVPTVNASKVPTIPEPEMVCCLLVAGMVLSVALIARRRKRDACA